MINTSFIHTIIKIQGHCHILKTFSVIKENANSFFMKIVVTRHFVSILHFFSKKYSTTEFLNYPTNTST